MRQEAGMDKMLRQEEVAEAIGFSRGHIWRMVSQRRLPPPYRMGLRSVRWKQSEIQGWIDDLQRKQAGG